MLNVIVENEQGKQLNLTSNENYKVLQVLGLTPPAAAINTAAIANKDGEEFNNSRLEKRNITMLIAPQGNIEKSRINLYKYINSKHYIKLYLKNATLDVWIDGYVESIESDYYTNSQQISVSIICPNPYFKSVNNEAIEFSSIVSKFEFPFAIEETGIELSTISIFGETNVINQSDTDTEMVIEIHATALALEPTIHNAATNKFFTLNHEFQPSDLVVIDTRTGKKSVKLIRNGVETNILNKMEKGSSWLTLVNGDNIISYTAVSGAENLHVRIVSQPIFGGI